MFNINNYLEFIQCPCCENDEYHVIKQANYSNIKTQNDLEQIYKSSADEKLLDRLVECKKCAFQYLNPRIQSNIINKSYENIVDNIHVSQDASRIYTFNRSLKKIIKILKISNTKKFNFLDIGSASGAFLKALKYKGFNETGYEPSKWMVDYGRREYSINLHQGRIQDISNEKKFDFISFWDVIEHVTDLNATLKKIDGISKTDTILIINVPDTESYACKMLKFKWPFYLNVHLYYFNKKSIKKVFEKINFELVDSFPHIQFLELAYLCKRASNYIKFFAHIENIIKTLKIGKISIPYNLGQTTYILKKK